MLNAAVEENYDRVRKGPFFKKQEDFYVYFHRLHPYYSEDGTIKGVTNEIRLGRTAQEAERGKSEFVFAARPMSDSGFSIHRDKDGFSPLFVLRDAKGRVIYGAYSPLQSLEGEDGSYLYVTGTASAPGSIPFPQAPMEPAFDLVAAYYPSDVERKGEVLFRVRDMAAQPISNATGGWIERKAGMEERVSLGEVSVSMDEVRYWASMNVYYHPGSGLIAASFLLAVGGITLVTSAKLLERKGG